jgi:hypothetical protein
MIACRIAKIPDRLKLAWRTFSNCWLCLVCLAATLQRVLPPAGINWL